jgi:hypothetical protein
MIFACMSARRLKPGASVAFSGAPLVARCKCPGPFRPYGYATFGARPISCLFAIYEGPHARRDRCMLGAAFHIPTAIVPPLLIDHFSIF